MKRKKSNIDGGESFPCFRYPVDPIFEELKRAIIKNILRMTHFTP